MRRYIFGERDGIYIIDLLQTEDLLGRAQRFADALAHRGGTVLFVGTKKQARDAIREIAEGRTCPTSTTAGSGPADQLPDDQPADQAPPRPRGLCRRGPTRPAADARTAVARGRSGEAPGQPRRRQEHAARAGCDVRLRHQDRGDRRGRGAPAAHTDHRPRGHQLRSGRHRLPRPRQRRRDPLLRDRHQGDRRRGRHRARDVPRRGGEGPPRGRGEGATGGRGEGPPRSGGEGPARGGGGRRRGRRGPAAGGCGTAGGGTAGRAPAAGAAPAQPVAPAPAEPAEQAGDAQAAGAAATPEQAPAPTPPAGAGEEKPA